MCVRKSNIWTAVLLAFAIQILTWFVLYPLAGYNNVTLLFAQIMFLALALLLVSANRLSWKEIGADKVNLASAILGILVSYSLLLSVLLILNGIGIQNPIFRQRYGIWPFANNWILTGFGEELFFAGILFNLISSSVSKIKRWTAVLLTAGLFALWHLPGYLAIGLKMESLGPDLAFDLLLPMISWGFFGTIYLFSGNLWLTAFVHASTDYALLPAVTQSPALGLMFMFSNVAIAWWLGYKSNRVKPVRTTQGHMDCISK